MLGENIREFLNKLRVGQTVLETETSAYHDCCLHFFKVIITDKYFGYQLAVNKFARDNI